MPGHGEPRAFAENPSTGVDRGLAVCLAKISRDEIDSIGENQIMMEHSSWRGLASLMAALSACAPTSAVTNIVSAVTSEQEAIELAERFVSEQGYTDAPADPRRFQPQGGDVLVVLADGGFDTASGLSLRHGTLEAKAYGIVTTYSDPDVAYLVVFRCSAALRKENDVGCEQYGAAVLVMKDGSLSRRHTGVRLDSAKKVP
jgi:hypothetical protein